MSTRAAADHGLRELARFHGIQTTYTDMAGNRHDAGPDVMRALLEQWQVSAGNTEQVREALRYSRLQQWQRVLPPVIVAWQGRGSELELRLPEGIGPRPGKLQIRLEHGPTKTLAWSSRPSRRARVEGRAFVSRNVVLPRLPPGYHQVKFEWDGRVARSLLICAPQVSYSPATNAGRWGLFLPVYAAHGRHSWGGGNLRDWERVGQWAAAQGVSTMGTLPLTATFLEGPLCDPSPYAPASRMFWNEFFLDLEAIPEFSECQRARRLVASKPFQSRLARLRQNRLIDYRAEMAVRRQVLQGLSRFFFQTNSARRAACEQCLEENEALKDYAEFRAVYDQQERPWSQWDARLYWGKIQAGDYRRADRDYHLYAQWIAQEQVAQFHGRACAQKRRLYFDLPLGVHPDSYDVWRHRRLFALGARMGAPPDQFFARGQDWGLPPLHPQRVREQQYDYVIKFLRFQMAQTDLLRIDHVMGLHRLFWIPQGLPAAEGTYVTYPAEEMHAILNLESHRHRTVLVGENLGTVPPEVNAAMDRHHLRKMYVVQFEMRPDPRKALPLPPPRCVASLNTHDTPTFAGFWNAADAEEKAALGLIPVRTLSRERRERARLVRALAAYLRAGGYLTRGDTDRAATFEACLRCLKDSSAEFILINLEDVWGEIQPQNVPGTSSERPNWRRKARLAVEEIIGSEPLQHWLKGLAAPAIRPHGRVGYPSIPQPFKADLSSRRSGGCNG